MRKFPLKNLNFWVFLGKKNLRTLVPHFRMATFDLSKNQVSSLQRASTLQLTHTSTVHVSHWHLQIRILVCSLCLEMCKLRELTMCLYYSLKFFLNETHWQRSKRTSASLQNITPRSHLSATK